MAVLPTVKSALCAASQLPGEGSTDVEDAPTPACLLNLMMMIMMIKCICYLSTFLQDSPIITSEALYYVSFLNML